ncbi:M56 family metallopeptidase [Sorangium sp. So ce1036]|uniref:M56 family metallopeptidase n=1 Tax=Sorangium sp. So ce1036 TaxID=3133328 RepID=UPI003F0D830A
MTPPLASLPLGAAFVAFALVSAWAVGLVARFAVRWPSPGQRLPSTALRAAVVFAPAVLGAVGCAALALPNPLVGCHCAEHGLHHPHLCALHLVFALPLVTPSAYLVGAWLALVAPGVLRLVRDAIASARWTRAVRRLPAVALDGVAVRLADCGAPTAFTIGALSPVIVVDRVLFRSLSDEERRAVVHHERAHVERRDGLTLLALRLCVSLFPGPAGQRLVEAWRAAAEQSCDRHAAGKLGDPTAVAAALVAVEKIRAQGSRRAALPAHAMGALAGNDLSRRVLALLEVNTLPQRTEPRLANDVLATAIVAASALLLTFVWPGDGFHHAIETLIGHLIH